jgi:hypothetical protein
MLSYIFHYSDKSVKVWAVLPLTLGSDANNRLPEDDNAGNLKCFLCSKSCMVSGKNIAVHFDYQQ